jgi:proton-translocating NADH-quinone oxidoreductase chain N
MNQWLFLIFSSGFAAAIAIMLIDLLAKRSPKYRASVSGLIAIIGYAVMGYSIFRIANELPGDGQLIFSLVSSPLATTLVVSRLSIYVSAIALVLCILTAVYTIGYMSKSGNVAIFYAITLFLALSIIGVTISGDLLTLFIFWEGMSVSAYALVAFRKRSWEAIEATIKYILLSGVGSLAALYGIALLYGVTGTLNLQSLAPLVSSPSPILALALAFILAGFGVEAAIAPMHTWLPDAHPAAPTPMSALLSGIIIEIGSFTFMRILGPAFSGPSYVAVLQPLIAIFAIVTMFVGNLSALYQDDLKRLLAYSSIAQVGYILFGISTFTIAGFSASLLHIWNHALLKGLFFLLAGIVSYLIGTRSLSSMAGIGRRNPILAVLFGMTALAMTGVPPFGMFWSEFLIAFSALAVQSPLLSAGVVLMLVNILISIVYYFRVIRIVVFSQPADSVSSQTKAISWLMIGPAIALIVLSLITGIVPSFFYEPAVKAIQALLGTA